VETVAPPLRLGLIGCADFAWRRMLPALDASPDVTLAAVASRDEEKAARFAARFGCTPVRGYDALLEAPGIDAVYVPLPAMLTAEWIEKALLAGKHVLAEKPLTSAVASTQRLVELARSRGLVLLENVAFPHHSQYAAVGGLLAEGAIGEIRDFSAAFTIPPMPEENIRYQPHVGGGALLDMGIYPIRAALHFLGPDIEIAAAVLRRQSRTDAVVAGRILAHTPRGGTIDLSFGMEHSYRSGYEIAGSTGRLGVDRAFTPPPAYQPVVRIERQDHREEITLRADDQFANVIAFFVRAVRTGSGVESFSEASLRQAQLVGAVEEKALRITI
jgi:dTDP-3,4-didehydro-2,6-dideoxy-alpha-D-glucose 3-reductase